MASSEATPGLSELTRHLSFGAVMTISQAFSGFIMAAVNIRNMTVEDFAGLAILLAIATGVAHFMGQALCSFASRESARATGANRTDDAGLLAFLLVISVSGTIASFWLAHLLSRLLWQDVSILAAHLSGAISAFGVMTLVAAGLLQGLGRPVRAHAGISSQSIIALAMCLLMLMSGGVFSLESLLWVHALSSALVAIWMVSIAARRTIDAELPLTALTTSRLRERIMYLLPLWGSVGLGAVTMKLPMIFAGAVLLPGSVATLSIATQFGALARSVPSILSRSLSRCAQQAHRDGNTPGLRALIRRAELVAAASVAFMVIGFLILGRPVLQVGFDIDAWSVFQLSLAMIALGGLQVIVGLRQGLLGMFGYTMDVMLLKSLEVAALAAGLFMASILDLGLWAIIGAMTAAFIVHAGSTHLAMRHRSILS